jgi:hypothetical protein
MTPHDRTVGAMGLATVAAIFAGLWWLNGLFSVVAFQGLGAGFWWAVLLHVGITAIEVAMAAMFSTFRRAKLACGVYLAILLVVFLACGWDIATSAYGLQAWLSRFGAPSTLAWNAGYTMAALFIALAPEPVLVGVWRSFGALSRGG